MHTIAKPLALVATFALSMGMSSAHAAPYTASNIANNVRDMGGVVALTSGDDKSVAVTLPFAFNFYGTDYRTAYISTNGFLSFTISDAACCNGQSFPGARIGAAVAPAWTDWVAAVSSKTTGAVGTQEYVVSWTGAEFGNGANPANFQAILHEGSNNIEFQYGKTFASGHVLGSGIQSANGAGAVGLNLSTSNFSGRGVLISAVPEADTYAMLLAGLGLIGVVGRRRRAAV
jgi:hypothetical protein